MLKQNDIYEVTISGYTSEGMGVAKIDNIAVFIPNVIEGERCRIRITHVMKSFATAALQELLTESQHRVRPVCKKADLCGGCVFLHMDYEEECRLKAQRVKDALNRIGGQNLEKMTITGSPSIFQYRNKAQFPVAAGENGIHAGFFAQHTHRVIPINRCRIQNENANLVKAAVIEWMNENHISAYDENTGKGLVRHIYARVGVVTGQVLACVVVNGAKLPKEETLAERLKNTVPGLKTVILSCNEKRGNTVLGNSFRTIYGMGTIEDELCGFRFRLSPQSFYQVNHDQAENLYRCAVSLAELTKNDTVLDLYCGTGTITLCLAREAGKAIGVEIIDGAIRDAKENAARNGVENVQFFCSDAGTAAKQFAEENIHPNVIVVDPPRKGLDANVIEAMVTMNPERIVYVSCDPATLARDVKLLSEHYRLEHAEAFDMFPRCAHVETVVKLNRIK